MTEHLQIIEADIDCQSCEKGKGSPGNLPCDLVCVILGFSQKRNGLTNYFALKLHVLHLWLILKLINDLGLFIYLLS